MAAATADRFISQISFEVVVMRSVKHRKLFSCTGCPAACAQLASLANGYDYVMVMLM